MGAKCELARAFRFFHKAYSPRDADVCFLRRSDKTEVNPVDHSEARNASTFGLQATGIVNDLTELPVWAKARDRPSFTGGDS